MTEQNHEHLAIFTDGDGRRTYAVPLSVLEAHRATPEQRAAFEAAMHDTEGFSLAPDEPVHLLPAEALEPYRLSDEQRDALPSRGDHLTAGQEVEGYSYSPNDPYNQGFGSGGFIWTNYRYMDGSQGDRWIQAWGAQSLRSNPDANYYPKLH